MPALASTINQTAKFMIRCQIWYILLRKPCTYIQLLLSTIHINRDLIKYVSMRYIMQENENVSWKSCPKISNSKWQHPCWLACFSIKLGYTSDEERWPTSILMTCFTCVWVNKCVCEREKWMERGSEKDTEKKREKLCVFGSSWPLLCPKGSIGLQTLHCIMAEEGGRDSGLKRGFLDRRFRECCTGGNNKWGPQ